MVNWRIVLGVAVLRLWVRRCEEILLLLMFLVTGS